MELLTRREAAAYLRVSGPRFFLGGRGKSIPFAMIGGRAVYRRDDLDAFIEAWMVRHDDAPAPVSARRTFGRSR